MAAAAAAAAAAATPTQDGKHEITQKNLQAVSKGNEQTSDQDDHSSEASDATGK